MAITFITGPVRSGKSRFAQDLARASGRTVTYVAAATLGEGDAEWVARIERHKAERDPAWKVVETAAPGAPALAELVRASTHHDLMLIESSGSWLAARLDVMLAAGAVDAVALEREVENLSGALLAAQSHIVVVAEEAGWGLVPESASGRLFRDVLGRFHQRLATHAEHAFLVVSGFAIDLHAVGRPIAS